MQQTQEHQYFNIRPSFIALILASAIAILIFFHSVVMVCWYTKACGVAMDPINRFGHMFDLNREMNIPTWFSVIQLFVTACSLALAAWVQRLRSRSAIAWWGLAVIFFYMSLDEATDMHGLWRIDGYVVPGTTQALFSWIIPAVFVVLIIALIYIRWLITLPRRTTILFFVAGAVFVTGALIFEGIGAVLADETFFTPSYLIVSTMEETLELFGVLIMLYAVLDYLQGQGLKIALVPESSS